MRILCYFILSLLAVQSYADELNVLAEVQTLTNQRIFEELQKSQYMTEDMSAYEKMDVEASAIIADERPCFFINSIRLSMHEAYYYEFLFLEKELNKKSTGVIGRCIGEEGIKSILSFSQDLLIEKGFVTSRVVINSQDLNSGILVLGVVVGTVADIYRQENDERINLNNALTFKSGEILNLRKLEQSIENLNFPNHVKANIKIEPSRQSNNDNYQGISDLVISRSVENPVSAQLIMNNFGNHSTGVYQAGLGLTVNEPLFSNDKFYVQYLRSLEGVNNTPRPASNENLYINYQYPLREWRLGLSYHRSHYTQSLKGLNHDPLYEGISENKEVKLTKSLYRGSDSKLSAYGGVAHRKSDYLIEGVKIPVQARRVTHYTLGFDYEKVFRNYHHLTVDFNVNKGGGAFKALPLPERFYSEVDSRPLIWRTDISYRFPFQVGVHNFGYRMHLEAQYSEDNLGFNDKFTMGDRSAVRGFDGRRLLSTNQGVIFGQEVFYRLNKSNPHQIYMAVDRGILRDDINTSNHHAMGGVLGYRFSRKRMNFDGYVGFPIMHENLSNKINVGVQLAFSY